jgi:SAM-dependent methyltransferase
MLTDMPVDIVDFQLRVPMWYNDSRKGLFTKLRTPSWDCMYHQYAASIFEKGGTIVDIGGGLRIDQTRGNRANAGMVKLFGHYLTRPNVQYKITDYTNQYHPDFVEDIHKLSFQDNSIDGLFCIAVLEHVYDPKRAAEEIVRVLKPGGHALIYVPFVYRYHAHANDYRDYFRYTKDGIAYLFRDCAEITLCPVRGLFETLLRFLPLHAIPLFQYAARFLDQSTAVMRSISAKQTSGYNVFIRK